MPIIQPDTSEISGPIEAGTYPAKIVAADPGVSKSGGQKLVVKFEVNVGGKNVPRQVHMPITGQGAFGFDSLLRACHFDDLANKLRDKNLSPKPAFNTDDLISQELHVTVEPDTYNGQLTDKITGYLPK